MVRDREAEYVWNNRGKTPRIERGTYCLKYKYTLQYRLLGLSAVLDEMFEPGYSESSGVVIGAVSKKMWRRIAAQMGTIYPSSCTVHYEL